MSAGVRSAGVRYVPGTAPRRCAVLWVNGDRANGDRYVPVTAAAALLDPFEHPGCRIATGDVAEVEVIQAHADALALVLGELAVNSSKHGALSGTGEIAVRAQLAGEDFTVIWDEHSNRPVASHARTGGQGLRLMQRILAARRGAIDIDWHEHGLTATVRLPLG